VDLHPLFLQGRAIQSALEGQFINTYLLDQGFERSDIKKMPRELARKLMVKACQYASLKLAEIEARSKFIKKIT
jgi:hypothetical protein